MEAKNNNNGFGLWGFIIGILVVVISVAVMVMLNGRCQDDRANEDLTWVG